MSQVHDIGPLFVQRMWYQERHGAPLVSHIMTTQEIEYPYRFGLSRAYRLPFTRRAVILGQWGGVKDEEEALMGAVRGREIGPA